MCGCVLGEEFIQVLCLQHYELLRWNERERWVVVAHRRVPEPGYAFMLFMPPSVAHARLCCSWLRATRGRGAAIGDARDEGFSLLFSVYFWRGFEAVGRIYCGGTGVDGAYGQVRIA
jgi:hypothetical protein